MSVVTNYHSTMIAALFLAHVLASSGNAAPVLSSGYAVPWGGNMVTVAPEVALAQFERLVNRAWEGTSERSEANVRVRLIGPEALLAHGGLSDLVMRRQVYRWAILAPLDGYDRVFWLVILPDRDGVAIRYGMWYASRRACLMSRVRLAADRYLPERWQSPESRFARAFQRYWAAAEHETPRVTSRQEQP